MSKAKAGMALGRGTKRIWGVITAFILLGTSIILVGHVGDRVLSGVRAYIYGEGQWTKAQKQATIALLQLLHDQDEKYYYEFKDRLSVNEGDRMGRETLSSDQPDLELARRGFLQGKNHPDDIDNLIWLFLNFKDVAMIQDAIEIWEEGDAMIDRMRELADEIYNHIQNGTLDRETTERYKTEVSLIDDELTELEVEFSSAMSMAARKASELVFWATISISMIFILLAAFISISFMRSLKLSNEKLAQSERKFKNVLDNSRDVIYQHKPGADHYDYVSSSVEDMTGYTVEEVMAGGPDFIQERMHPEDQEELLSIHKSMEEVQHHVEVLQDSEFRVKRADGEIIWVNIKRKPVLDENGRLVAVVGNARDVTKQKEHLEQIDQALQENNTLLSEMHHRIKNNLGIVSSLIELQKDGLDDSLVKKLQEIQLRMSSIVLIHEKLYKTKSFNDVDLSEYIRELTSIISDIYSSEEKDIDVVYNLDLIRVNSVDAESVGLICNELISNCYKHAFNGQKKGRIEILLKRKEEHLCLLRVSDDGGNLPDDFNLENQQTMGITLVRTLTNQVKGDLRYEAGEITSFEIIFPL